MNSDESNVLSVWPGPRTGTVVGTSWSGLVALLFPYVSDFKSPGPTGISLALVVTTVQLLSSAHNFSIGCQHVLLWLDKQVSWVSRVVDARWMYTTVGWYTLICSVLCFQKQRHRCVASPLRCFLACFRCLYSFKLRWKDGWKWFPRMAGTITHFLMRFCWILFGHPWAISGIPFCDCT